LEELNMHSDCSDPRSSLRAARSRRHKAATVAVAAALLAACGGGSDEAIAERESPAGAGSCTTRKNDSIAKLLECVTLAAVRTHQAAFQQIADATGGTRAAGTPGYDASVDYVVTKLAAAGYQVSLHGLPFTYLPPPSLRQLTPFQATYATGAFTGTGYGSAAGNVVAVDINLALPRTNTSGCEAADFAGFPAGSIALIQRGTCTFAVKALNAEAAGAAAVVIFNQGDTPAREALVTGTLGGDNVVAIPVVGASFADGAMLAQAPSSAAVSTFAPVPTTQYNVIAESVDGNPNNVVMAGAHLDSVQAGPGINDNGSGSAALLEVALQMAKVKPRNKLRFAWWGAEEAGLVGSTAYVADLNQAQRDAITLYLNFDMVGSPNYVFFIYDGDDSDAFGEGAGPVGSEFIEQTFERFYRERGIPFKGTDFSGRSDYGPFIAIGIPSGGLFTGAEGVKTAEEQALWGGTAGEQYDPCYHLACDTLANNSDRALDVNADAIAYAILKYAMNTQEINDAKSKGNFKKLIVPYPPPPAM
jgi:Zn-dependent M28 family amino/carboxypeptidase